MLLCKLNWLYYQRECLKTRFICWNKIFLLRFVTCTCRCLSSNLKLACIVNESSFMVSQRDEIVREIKNYIIFIVSFISNRFPFCSCSASSRQISYLFSTTFFFPFSVEGCVWRAKQELLWVEVHVSWASKCILGANQRLSHGLCIWLRVQRVMVFNIPQDPRTTFSRRFSAQPCKLCE